MEGGTVREGGGGIVEETGRGKVGVVGGGREALFVQEHLKNKLAHSLISLRPGLQEWSMFL